MAFLKNLPNELLNEIFSNLDSIDLVRTIRVSRHLRVVAEPFLYRTVSLISQRIHHVLRTLLARPSLRNHVRSFSILPGSCEPFSLHQSPAEAAQYTTTLESFKLKLPMCDHGAQVALLLHLLPNLQVFDPTNLHNPEVFDAFMAERSHLCYDTLPVGLRSLREFHRKWFGVANGASAESFLTLLMLPSIRIIEERIVEEMTIDSLDLDKFAGKSTVKHLKFFFGDTSASSLSLILQIPCALTHFSYGYSAMQRQMNINGHDVEVALRPLRPTLEFLELYVLGDWSGDRVGDVPSTVGVFRDWPVLRKIKSTITALLGPGRAESPRLITVLPVVIQEFELTSNDHWRLEYIEDQIVEMLELKVDYGLNQLKVLKVGGRCWETEGRLEALCDTVDVAFVDRSVLQ